MKSGVSALITDIRKEDIMRKQKTRFASVCAAAALAVSLSASVCVNAFAFYQTPAGKKGLLISQQTNDCLQDLTNLGINQVICNLGSDQNINAYDPLANYSRSHGITMSMILINRWGASSSLLPVSSRQDGVGVYGFNVLDASGESAVRSYAASVARHYSSSVSNWIIGNEVNDALQWDYNGVMNMEAHAETYAKAFRIFYEEIKKANPEARVFIPFNMCWNATLGIEGSYPVSGYLPLLNEKLRDTEYGIAWHPYPVHFFNKPEFLDDDGISEDLATTPNINLKNIHLLTDYLQTEGMRTPSGEVRHLLLTEQGFTSACENGEQRQAEAIRQAWDIVQANPFIEGFYLTRQVDAAGQEAAGGAFGLWTRDPGASRDEVPRSKKQAWSVYQSLR